MKWIKVASRAQLVEKGRLRIDPAGGPILLIHQAEDPYAVADSCTHQEESLADGFIEEDTIECAHHGARYDLRSGHALCLPALTALRTYPVRCFAQDICLGFEGEDDATTDANDKRAG
jgi:3-phenylpropionate/trans-cinnamate dioxygenase ferredoxin subunit